MKKNIAILIIIAIIAVIVLSLIWRASILKMEQLGTLSGSTTTTMQYGPYGCGAVPQSIILHAINDEPAFAADDQSVYWLTANGCPITIPHADPKTFAYLGFQYGKDASNVYFQSSTIQEAEATNFSIIDAFWAKDKNNVFFKGKVVAGADAQTFASIKNTDFLKDKNRVYAEDNHSSTSTAPNIFTEIDPASFQQINSSLYFKDRNGVYIDDRLGSLTLLQGADPASFQVLGGCAGVEMSVTLYTKDQHIVWCGTEIIKNADPATFQYVGNYEKNTGGMPASSGIAKDKNCIYRAGLPILDDQGKCFSPVSCTTNSITTSCDINRP